MILSSYYEFVFVDLFRLFTAGVVVVVILYLTLNTSYYNAMRIDDYNCCTL